MGNEDKINKDVTKARAGSRFLPDEIHDLDGAGELYSLDAEFEKAKKNRNFKLYFLISLFIAIIIGGVFLFTMYSEELNKIVEIDISEFEDLRVKDIIDSARKRGGNIDVMRIKLQVLDVEMLDKMLKVRNGTHLKELNIVSQNLSDEETNRQLSDLKSEEKRKLAGIKARYKRKIRQKRREISSLEWEKNKDEKKIKAEGESIAVSNEDKLYALKMKKLKQQQKTGTETVRKYFDKYMKFLEKKYNPRFKSARINEIVTSGVDSSLSKGGQQTGYDPFLSSEVGFSEKEFSRLKSKINNYSLLMKRLKRVPYRNSVPDSLERIDSLSGGIVKDYEVLRAKLVKAVKIRNKYKYTIDYLIDKSKGDGMVVDGRDRGNILLLMSEKVKVRPGDTARVYRGNRKIGKIKFFKDNKGQFRAKVIDAGIIKPKIEPLNKIVLDK